MSKRHRKTKDFLSPQGSGEDVSADTLDFDLDMFETPRGKKPKGKHRREVHKQKRAYYDD